jgi:hypothetical protein
MTEKPPAGERNLTGGIFLSTLLRAVPQQRRKPTAHTTPMKKTAIALLFVAASISSRQ